MHGLFFCLVTHLLTLSLMIWTKTKATYQRYNGAPVWSPPVRGVVEEFWKQRMEKFKVMATWSG